MQIDNNDSSSNNNAIVTIDQYQCEYVCEQTALGALNQLDERSLVLTLTYGHERAKVLTHLDFLVLSFAADRIDGGRVTAAPQFDMQKRNRTTWVCGMVCVGCDVCVCVEYAQRPKNVRGRTKRTNATTNPSIRFIGEQTACTRWMCMYSTLTAIVCVYYIW